MDNLIIGIKDPNLKLTLAYGIGLHHAGLSERDRKVVEELFCNQKIQILVATSTLAWGVNFPAHLVVIKGTEYFDGKTHRYVDFPITDVLQMMGRAGRPQYDDRGVAVVLVQDTKKQFYKKFLYEPFPVESNLLAVLPEHLNAEIVSRTIKCKVSAVEYITKTFMYRRLLKNPSYYGLENLDDDTLFPFLDDLITNSIKTLMASYCVKYDNSKGDENLYSTSLGHIASYYYIHYSTIGGFVDKMSSNCSLADVVKNLAFSYEFNEIPVRHNEDLLNAELAKKLPLPSEDFLNSNTKAFLLLQAYFSQVELPMVDYETDLKSVLDQAIRVTQAMLDVSVEMDRLTACLQCSLLLQMIIQGAWAYDNPLYQLPYLNAENLHFLKFHIDNGDHNESEMNSSNGNNYNNSETRNVKGARDVKPTNKKYLVRAEPHFNNNSTPAPPGGWSRISSLPQLLDFTLRNELQSLNMFKSFLPTAQAHKLLDIVKMMPILNVSCKVHGPAPNSTKAFYRNICLEKVSFENLHYIPVTPNTNYKLTVNLQRINKVKDTRVYSRRYAKQKNESWILIIGDLETSGVVAVKRVTPRWSNSNSVIDLAMPSSPGKLVYRLFILSDSYIGLDQQYDIHLDVVKSTTTD